MNQSELTQHLKKHLTSQLTKIFTEASKRSLITTVIAQIDFERLLLMSAQRKAYGAPPKHHDLYADVTPEAIWSWELTSPSLYIEPASFLRELLSHREAMQSMAYPIQSLQKLV